MMAKALVVMSLAGAFILIGTSCGPDPDPSRWMLQVDTVRSDVDGSVRLAATLELPGQDGLAGKPRDGEARLRFECRRGTGAFAALLTTRSLASGSAALRFKLDSLPVYAAPAATGQFGEWGMVYISQWSELLDHLRGHRSLLVEYAAGRTPRAVAEFSVVGIDSVRPLFLAACAKQ